MELFRINHLIDILISKYDFANNTDSDEYKNAHEHYLRHLRFEGKDNLHLHTLPTIPAPTPFDKSYQSWDGTEVVYGEFLLIYSDMDDQTEVVYTFNTLEEIPAAILSSRGLVHPSCRNITVIHNENILPYKVSFRAGNGLIIPYLKPAKDPLFYLLHQEGCSFHFSWVIA
ncbi:hypothetical protein CN918_25485 [Priestia megaterium]|nr:hypothetical protein CN918_25485 [Priestia megaterium]